MTQVFQIAPAAVRPFGVVVPLVIVLVIIGFVGTLVFVSLRGATSATFELSPDGLRLKGDLYGRFIPASELRAGDAARVDISTGPLRPTFRTAGTAVPGYRGGWFKLANGNKALLYVTDPQQVVLVPTTAGYSVLLSVTDADRFVERLHAMAPGGR